MTDPVDERSRHSNRSRYINRELSWLEFNARVLALAEDPATPLLERVRFVAIFSQNLDEFFQVRVAGLKDRVAAGVSGRSPDGLSAAEQLEAISARTAELVDRADEVFLGSICSSLADEGIVFSTWGDLDADDREWATAEFRNRIFPVLTPLAVDPGHPFPYISSLSLNLGVIVRDPTTDQRRFARVKVPSLLPRFVVMPDGERFVPLEQVIAEHLDELFPGMEVLDHVAFRVTRNADLTVEEEDADDLLAAIEMELRRRRFGKAVRLQVEDDISAEALELIRDELELTDDDVVAHSAPLDLGGLFAVADVDRPDLKYPLFVPVTQHRLGLDEDEQQPDLFAVMREGDVLVHHPYDSFSTSVEEFIRQSAADPKVLTIKLTLYRTSGDSPIVGALIKAAEAGKQVVALVELKARFDEERNIEWARRLEQAGVHVVYGLVGLKTHTKTCLVVRDEGDRVNRYCHIGTGNYNSKTARLYEDVGLLTADPDLGADLTQLFNYLTGYARDVQYSKLLVAPHTLRDGLVHFIRNERRATPGTGHIVMKMNSLVDADMIDELYAASADGVRVELIVRGISCIRPGVAGLSENITVRSIVGRYLEHSRIYRFANGRGPGEELHFIGSADLMPRNLDRRVEAVVPVRSPELRVRMDEILAVSLADDTLAWRQVDDGWSHVERRGTVETHIDLQEHALKRASVGRR
ncbi:MAG: RNA degradosome polyphosphate kinase [Actinobacteria bacterium]|nr:RNA degradosome polyphosphate kinase [Actinomycetota bacterium]